MRASSLSLLLAAAVSLLLVSRCDTAQHFPKRYKSEGSNFESCSDGLDNDEDGLVDCDDPDCAGTIPCQLLGPEDTVLQKLRWFRLGGEVSERQWRDIVAVLRLSQPFDETYLRDTAEAASLGPLLVRAMSDARGQSSS